jgi:hypothetical protein
MSTAPNNVKPPKTDVAIGLVAQAWRDVRRESDRAPGRTAVITPVKPQRPGRKSGIYRIERAGDGGADVVAKRCLRATGAVERRVHERLLPRLDVPALRYYGYVDEPDSAFCWLFLGDAGETKLVAADRELAAEWLAHLHTSAAALADRVQLPDRGPAHYLTHLRAGRVLIGTMLRQLVLPDEVQSAMRTLLRLSERMESRWATICAPCDAAPRTLVHGDFARQNLRIRDTTCGAELVALDWETAGWGPPAADIPFWPTRYQRPRDPTTDQRPPRWNGTVPLDVYARHAGGQWSGARMRELESLARVGTVFRAVAAVHWAAQEMQGGGTSRAGERMCWAVQLLTRVLAELDC